MVVCLSASFEALCVYLIYADCVQDLVVVEALAWAWVLLQGHEGEGSLAVGPHKVEDRSLEARAVPVQEQFLWELFHTQKRRKKTAMKTGVHRFSSLQILYL